MKAQQPERGERAPEAEMPHKQRHGGMKQRGKFGELQTVSFGWRGACMEGGLQRPAVREVGYDPSRLGGP